MARQHGWAGTEAASDQLRAITEGAQVVAAEQQNTPDGFAAASYAAGGVRHVRAWSAQPPPLLEDQVIGGNAASRHAVSENIILRPLYGVRRAAQAVHPPN